MGLTGSPETSVSNHLTPSNNPEDGRIQLNCGWSERSRKNRNEWTAVSILQVTSLSVCPLVCFTCLSVCGIVIDKWWEIEENVGGFQRKRSWSNLSSPGIFLEDWERLVEIAIRLAGIPAECRTPYFPNTSLLFQQPSQRLSFLGSYLETKECKLWCTSLFCSVWSVIKRRCPTPRVWRWHCLMPATGAVSISFAIIRSLIVFGGGLSPCIHPSPSAMELVVHISECVAVFACSFTITFLCASWLWQVHQTHHHMRE